MADKIRILFSIETADKWIFQAYKGFFDALADDERFEVFCTVNAIEQEGQQLGRYNVIDYRRLAPRPLGRLACDLSKQPNVETYDRAGQFALWHSADQLLERFAFFRVTLSILQPDIVIVWNGMADVRGMARTLLEELNVPFFYAEKGMLPESWYIDQLGINARCGLDSRCCRARLDADQRQDVLAYIETVASSGASAWSQPARCRPDSLRRRLGVKEDSPIVFFAGQVDEDVNVTRFSAFTDVAEAVRLVVDSVPADVTVVAKPHPKSKSHSKRRLADLSGERRNLIVAEDVNIWDLIDGAELVVSINSTVAFEALLRRKKIILLGDGVLSNVGLAAKLEPKKLKRTIPCCLRASFDRFFDYSKVLAFVRFLRDHYYIFRDKTHLPDSVVKRIVDAAEFPSPKAFSRDEIMAMLAGRVAENDRTGVSGSRLAAELFTKAVAAFNREDFAGATELMQQYRQAVDYSQLPNVPGKRRDNGAVAVSVVVVTCRRMTELRHCLCALADQNDKDFEVIVVDNGGTDYEAIEHYVDRYIKCPINLNLSEGRNIGVHFARGRIVAFLDDDALVGPDYVSSIKSAFESFDIWGLRGRALPKTDPDANRAARGYDKGDRPFPTFCDLEGCSAFLRRIYLELNGMDPLLFGHEGSDLTYRIHQKYNAPGKVIYWPATTIYHDATVGSAQKEKTARYERTERYLKFKHNRDIWELRGRIEAQPLPVHPGSSALPAASAPRPRPSSNDTPVVLVVYNRPKHTLEVLKKLREHNITNLYIFSDAPKRPEDAESVGLVRRLIHSIDWTTPKIIERPENFGLARNITEAVDYVFELHDRLILLEDDCVPQQYFFDFMNTCLEKYENEPHVFGISGYSVPVPEHLLKDYPYDAYFSPRIGSWGWATWKRAWAHYEKDLHKLIEIAKRDNIDLTQGGTDIPVFIEKFITGRLKDVWTLNWVLSVYVNKGLYVYPTKSHVKNIGVDGTGQHCRNTTKYEPVCCETKPTRYPRQAFIQPELVANFRSYFTASPAQTRSLLQALGSVSRPKTLKISYVSTVDNKGGAAKVAWMLKHQLKARGHQTKMFVGRRFSDDQDVHVITDPVVDGGNEQTRRGLLYYDIKSTFSLARNSDFMSADVLHFHNLHGGYFNPAALPELTKARPSLWTLHDMQALTGHCAYALDCAKWQTGCGDCPDLQTYPSIPHDQTARMWQDKRQIYRRSDFELIVPSQWLKGLVEKSMLADKKVHLIYNGIDEQLYRPMDRRAVRRMFKVPSDAVIVGFLANKGLGDPRKGGGLILQSYHYLAQKYPNSFFICIGGVCEGAPRERFVQLPFVADENKLALFYNLMDVFLFPTMADNCPLVVLEVMGCGVPIVSFATGGVPELVRHGETGLLAEPGNTAQFIKMAEVLLTDAALRSRSGPAARRRLLQSFTLSKMVNQHERLYEQLVERADKRHRAAVAAGPPLPVAQPSQQKEYLVSAVVSTYNSERFIRGCLEDLENQTIADKLEIIVVNSGSEQNEEQIVREFQQHYDNIVYIKTDQRETVYSAWNRAIRVARGRFITNANTDDRHRRDALEVMAQCLEADPDVALVYGDQIQTDTPNDTFENHHGTEYLQRPDYSRRRLLFGCCVGSQPMWRKSLHEQFGWFDESLTCAGDWDFWLRISQKYEFKHIPQYLGLYYHNRQGIEHGRKIHSLYERYLVGKRYGNPYISVIPLYNCEGNPLVSVIMPAYNASAYIAEAIESVLIQNYRNFELIVIDDGSTDDTKDIICSFGDDKIKYFCTDHAGPAHARNAGVERSQGSFIFFLDADDMVTPDFIARHLRHFENFPDADLVYCDDCLIDAHGKVIRIIERPEYQDRNQLISDLFRCGFPVVPFRTCIRRSVFDRIGFFDEQLLVAEDYDMIRRFLKHNLNARHLKGAFYLRRMTSGSLSRNFTAEKARAHFEVVRRFTETFKHEQLFPDVAWDTIPQAARPLYAGCRAAMTYLAIGRAYVSSNAPAYTAEACELACAEIQRSLRTDPTNERLKRLLEKCRSVRDTYSRCPGKASVI